MPDADKVLITGVNGRIGQLLVAGLGTDPGTNASTDSSTGFELYGCDREGPFSARTTPLDIRDPDAVRHLVGALRPRYLVHLAGNAALEATWDSVWHDNIAGTQHVFEAAREAGAQRVVFASSNHVTGAYEGFAPDLHLHRELEPRKLTVQDPVRPDSLYGVSKAFGEALARYYAARFGLEAVCLRIGSVLADDDPSADARFRKTWLSHRDLVQLVRCALLAKVTFGIYYGISDNRGAFWDLLDARAELGYAPQDDAYEVAQPR